MSSLGSPSLPSSSSPCVTSRSSGSRVPTRARPSGLWAPAVASPTSSRPGSRRSSRTSPDLSAVRRSPSPSPGDLGREILEYVYQHPGCVSVQGGRRAHYSDGFRRFILELRASHPRLDLEAFAEAVRVPVGTLRDWLRASRVPEAANNPPAVPEPPSGAEPASPLGPQLETMLSEWRRWRGPFTAFCTHLREHCGIPFGSTLISRVLFAYGDRRPRRRSGRNPDEEALRGAFETFFPHAQWVGDGTLVPVSVDGELRVFNLELDVDAWSGAFLGAHVSPTEDSDAVIAAFADAVRETGVEPIALCLDNKPSNHTDDIHDALGSTLLIRSTPFRAQNKAHVEGAFGLLCPTLEGLELRASGSPEELAASFLRCLVTAVGRAINQRPRRDRGGKSRAQLADDPPLDEDIRRARRALEERLRKQNLARLTLAARQDPVVRATLRDAFERLGLDDPDDHFLAAIARYPLEAVVDAVAVFDAKSRAATLPPGADARYLLAIVRNHATEREARILATTLWDARVAARDRLALHLQTELQDAGRRHTTPESLLDHCVRSATTTRSGLERHFWLRAAADLILRQPHRRLRPLFDRAARHIASRYSTPPKTRRQAIHLLADLLQPLS